MSLFLLCLLLQGVRENQHAISDTLNYPLHKIHCNAKRLGGGFGGKESRPATLAAVMAVPAYHLRRPVRIALDRDEDMQTTGQRHAFMGKYKVPCHPPPQLLSGALYQVSLYVFRVYLYQFGLLVFQVSVDRTPCLSVRVTRMCLSVPARMAAPRPNGGASPGTCHGGVCKLSSGCPLLSCLKGGGGVPTLVLPGQLLYSLAGMSASPPCPPCLVCLAFSCLYIILCQRRMNQPHLGGPLS